MKRSFILILASALLLTGAFAFCSCGNDDTKDTKDTEEQKPNNTEVYTDGNDNVIDDPFDIETEASE
ncbi:MAG: hypothetical protein J5894_03870 [Clostridia bacterium]|nr:hypothetical protein [Clostridia bacterium]